MSNIIEKIVTVTNSGVTLYQFALPVKELCRLGYVSRLHENEGGVQRKLDEKRVQEMVEAMQKGKDLWLDSFLVHMEPSNAWVYENGVIVYDDTFRLSIDDGQHRFYAFKTLSEEQIKQLGEVNVIATYGLTMEMRLRLFSQQEMRKHIDRGMLLQGRDILGNWAREVDKNAYEMIKVLNSHELSPLRERIMLGENTGSKSKRYPDYLSTISLHKTLVAVLGDKSLIGKLAFEKQQDILLRFLNVAAVKVWPKQWADAEGSIISWNRGVISLLRLFLGSRVMRLLLVDGDYADTRLHSLLRLGMPYNWSFEHNRYRSEKEIILALDSMMSKRYTKRETDKQYRRNEMSEKE